MQRESGSHIEPVGFVIVHLREQFFAFLHDDVARGAGAVSSAGMIEEEVIVHSHIEDRFGLAVIGICRTADVRRNSAAQADDALILTKALGVGIYSAALKKGVLSPEGYAEMVASTTLLNRIGADLAKDPAVHAITDVTGFGLLGHALEMARGSQLSVVVRADELPLFADAAALARQGFVTGASDRNWMSYGEAVVLPPDLPAWRKQLLTDPQTSGGLLIACAPDRANDILQAVIEGGCPHARRIGHVEAGAAVIRVEA